VGIRVHDETSPAGPATASPSAIAVTSVTAYDPFGDGEENSDNAPYASDGDRTTVWRSEDYYDADLNKEGVGLLLDLGRTSDVSSIRLWTPSPGFAFSVRVGEDVQELTDVDVDETIATEDTRVQLEGSSGRYVLLWMTSVVPTGDGNRVEVADVRVLGTGR
jgi:putative peptidoglycan lipid II flippase